MKSFITFAVIVPLALLFGYLLTGPLDTSTLLMVGIVASILVFPLLLRWHYQLMLFCVNASLAAFFIPGHPPLWLAVVPLSFGIAILHRALTKDAHFISVPQVTWPLLFMAAVIIITAKLTGWGIRVMGSDVYGGKRYVYLLVGILAYFALVSRRIPPERAKWCVALFFLGGLTTVVGDLLPYVPQWSYFIFWLFPPEGYDIARGLDTEAVRFAGVYRAAGYVTMFMLAIYGIRGIFSAGKYWRLVLFCILFPVGLLGGFRTYIVFFGMFFVIQFFLEGLYRTSLLPKFAVAGIVVIIALFPLTPKLPYSVQRTLSVLPLPLQIDPAAQKDATASWDWRVKMWQAVLPQVPQYLWLGKGYLISTLDYNFVMGWDASVHSAFAQDEGLALSDDFHNGPLTIIIPLGIWGMIGFLWFLYVAAHVFYANYRYSSPSLQTVNTFLLAYFASKALFFLFLFGSFYDDMFKFTTMLGLSVALNGGVCRPVRKVLVAKPEARNFRNLSPAPAFQRRTG
ncbi:MAG TPA: O-antigen ligase family protein [Verrucomicrobiae bacterium]